MNILFSAIFASCDSNLIESNVYDSEEKESRCDISIIETIPFPDSTNAYYRNSIEVVLSDTDPTANVTVSTSETAVSGQLVREENTLIFEPEEPLLPSTQYEISVSYCGSEEPAQINFSTSDVGSPLNGGTTILEERSYMVDLSQGTVIEPLGIGDFLQTLLNNKFLIDVQQVNPTQAFVRMALSKVNTTQQNHCVPTIEEFPIVELEQEPYFTLSGTNIPIVIDEYQMLLYEFSTSGTINPQATEFVEMDAYGLLDLREVFPILQDFNLNAETVDDFVTYLEEFSVEISSCSDGLNYCMTIVMSDLKALEIQQDVTAVCAPNCHTECMSQSQTCDTPQELNESCTE